MGKVGNKRRKEEEKKKTAGLIEGKKIVRDDTDTVYMGIRLRK